MIIQIYSDFLFTPNADSDIVGYLMNKSANITSDDKESIYSRNIDSR